MMECKFYEITVAYTPVIFATPEAAGNAAAALSQGMVAQLKDDHLVYANSKPQIREITLDLAKKVWERLVSPQIAGHPNTGNVAMYAELGTAAWNPRAAKLVKEFHQQVRREKAVKGGAE